MKLIVAEFDVKDGKGLISIACASDDAARLNEFFEWAMKADEERDGLQEQLSAAAGLLKDIGDFAHQRISGPAVSDDLWEVRRMAYQQ